jgi:hypothetical protein
MQVPSKFANMSDFLDFDQNKGELPIKLLYVY